MDGTWQTFSRDLVSDLKQYEPDNELLAVNAFLVRGNVSVDDVELSTTFDIAISKPLDVFQGIPSYSPKGTLSVYRSDIEGHLIIVDLVTSERTTIQSELHESRLGGHQHFALEESSPPSYSTKTD